MDDGSRRILFFYRVPYLREVFRAGFRRNLKTKSVKLSLVLLRSDGFADHIPCRGRDKSAGNNSSRIRIDRGRRRLCSIDRAPKTVTRRRFSPLQARTR